MQEEAAGAGFIGLITTLWTVWIPLLFVGIVLWTLWPGKKREIEGHGSIPLTHDDDGVGGLPADRTEQPGKEV